MLDAEDVWYWSETCLPKGITADQSSVLSGPGGGDRRFSLALGFWLLAKTKSVMDDPQTALI
jgi:hypothetical protein